MRYLTLEGLSRVLRPFKVRLSNVISRGVVKRTDDAPGVQEIQAELLADEVRDELEHMQAFGFASNPDDGAECLVVFPGGDRAHGFVIATADRRYRVKVEKGEMAVYDKTGSKVLLKKTGDIELTPSSGLVKVTGTVEVTSDVKVAGQTHSAARGEQLNTAISNLATAIAGALTTMGASAATPMPGALAATAGVTITTAIGVFNAAAAAALSSKVKFS